MLDDPDEDDLAALAEEHDDPTHEHLREEQSWVRSVAAWEIEGEAELAAQAEEELVQRALEASSAARRAVQAEDERVQRALEASTTARRSERRGVRGAPEPAREPGQERVQCARSAIMPPLAPLPAAGASAAAGSLVPQPAAAAQQAAQAVEDGEPDIALFLQSQGLTSVVARRVAAVFAEVSARPLSCCCRRVCVAACGRTRSC